jgi:hypothetical protein
MALPKPETPLYSHPLPDIEQWLESQGCEQDADEPNHWHINRESWSADLWLEIDNLAVRYLNATDDGKDIQRSFKYSLSRGDLEEAIFSGP